MSILGRASMKKIACPLLILVPLLLYAQFGASLQGTITDSSGAAIPNAKATLTNNETGQKQTTQTSGQGFYRFTGLAPGRYTLSAESQNFSRGEVQDVTVNAEQTQGVNLTLTPGTVTQTVTVTAEGNQEL